MKGSFPRVRKYAKTCAARTEIGTGAGLVTRCNSRSSASSCAFKAMFSR